MTDSAPSVLDTFPAFLETWARWKNAPLSEQIDAWQTEYLGDWPELLEKQQVCYSSEGFDWRRIAVERIFPDLDCRLPAMKLAHTNLLRVAGDAVATARKVLSFEFDIVLVIYVGIGCGAGWATRYLGSPAVLLGLENIAECGWTEPPTLVGLIAHEIAHVVHEVWRESHGLSKLQGPWWLLYEEGFAQRGEHLILGHDSWHMRSAVDGTDWLDWCTTNRAWLASEFLRRVESGESVRPFFGSWYDLRGYRQTGYYLGHELIRSLEGRQSFRQLALLEEIEPALRNVLDEMVAAGQ